MNENVSANVQTDTDPVRVNYRDKITIVDVPAEFVLTNVLDITDLSIITLADGVPVAGSRTVVAETGS